MNLHMHVGVLPVLLFGCENWILNDRLMMQLERFQDELAMRALRWSKLLSNAATVVIPGLPTVRYTVLMRKLCLLLKFMDEEAKGVGANVFRYLLNDVSSMSLVKECRELVEYLDATATDSFLQYGVRQISELSRSI